MNNAIVCKECKTTKSWDKYKTWQRSRLEPICIQCIEQHKKDYAKQWRIKAKQTPKFHYKRYKHGAEQRNLTFELTFEDFLSYWQQPCSYCGDSIQTIGLDRMNNKIGYTSDNVTSCCFRCNTFKGSMDKDKFLILVTQIMHYTNDITE